MLVNFLVMVFCNAPTSIMKDNLQMVFIMVLGC